MNLKSIATTFVALMVTLLITISFVLLIASNKIIERKLTSNYIANSSEQMTLVAHSINKFYLRIDEDLNLFATHPLLKYDTSTTTSHELNQSIYYLLAQYAANHSGIQSIYFLTTDGVQVQWPISHLDNPYKNKFDMLISYFQSTDNTVFKSSPHLDIENNAVISHISPVYSTNGEILGMIGIDTSQAYISELLSTKTTVSDTAFFMLFDNMGLILADSRSPKNVLKSMSDLNIFQLGTLDILSKDTLTSLELSIDNDIYISSIIHLPHTNWFITSLILKSELIGPISKIIPAFIAASILLLLISTSLMGFATKVILHQKTDFYIQDFYDYKPASDSSPHPIEPPSSLDDLDDLFEKVTLNTRSSDK